VLTAFSKEVVLNEALASFMGTSTSPRSKVTQALWKYVKEKGLQNPVDKRQIICDTKLEALFKRKSVNMFKMTQLLAPVSLFVCFTVLSNYLIETVRR
jgi:upstream activation factor subunit UAF30